MKEVLQQGFQYDAWANRLWAVALNGSHPKILSPEAMERLNGPGPWPDFFIGEPTQRAGDVFCHILWANRIWLKRWGQNIQIPGGDPFTWIDALEAGWCAHLESTPVDTDVSYRNAVGDGPFVRSLSEIAQHVINHGTYHRGQLREISEYLSVDEIPNTDLVSFFFIGEEDA